MNAQVVGVSVDHIPCLKAWAESLGGIRFPLLSDFWPHGQAASEWGVFREEDGNSERAIFIVDAEGVVRYVDVHDIEDQPDNDALFAELVKLEPEAAGRLIAAEGGTHAPQEKQDEAPKAGKEAGEDEPAPSAQRASAGDAGIVMYCRSWCHDCKRAREWLDAQGIEYSEVDVDLDAEARAKAAALNEGALHTPTFEIGEDVCVDFRPERLRELLDMP
jgi:glutaredoxin